MKSRRNLLWTIALTVVGAALLHWGMACLTRRAGERLALIETQRQTRARQWESASARLAASDRRLSALRRRAEAASAPKPEIGQTAPPGQKGIGLSPQARLPLIANDPALRRLDVRAYVDERKVAFAGLLEKLGFTSGQRQKFEQIEAAYEEGLLDIAGAARDEGIPNSDPAVAKMRTELSDSLNAQTQALFGDHYNDWVQANWTLNPRFIVGEVLQKSYDGDGAISGVQADQLTQILAQNNARYQTGQQAADPASYNWETVLSEAEGILTPAQMEAFKAGTAARRLLASTGNEK